jgi:Tol biopolymer transport system component/DNA-binding winged helix-turn-helix (wHTH) protein
VAASESNSLRPPRYRFGRFRLLVDQRLLLCDDHPVALPPRAFDVLVVLVEHAGSLVTRNDLLSRVWAGAMVEEANLGVAVSALRRAIGHEHIETVPKYGYRFRASVERLEVQSPPSSAPESHVRPVRPSRRWLAVAACVGGLGLVALGSSFYRDRPGEAPSGGASGFRGLQRLTVSFASESNPSLSSRGRLIFMSDRDGDPEIYSADADGNQPQRLTTHPGVDDYPAWSPDGTHIAFASDRGGDGLQIHIMRADGSGLRRVTALRDSCIEPRWSPDGRRLAFQRNDAPEIGQDIYTVAIDGTDLTRITNRRAPDVSPAWSPDGRRIAFASRDDSGSDFDLYVVDVTGGKPRRLTFDPATDIYPAWSADGTDIVFASNRRGGDPELYLMPAGGGSAQRVLDVPGTQPSWTPDGTGIVFASTQPGNPEVFRLPLEPSVNLTGHQARDAFAAWSPDGSSIAFTSNRDGKLALFTMELAAGRIEKLTDGLANDWFPSWSSDGQRLVFQSDRLGTGGLDLCILEIRSRSTRCITAGRGTNASPAWSPDGRRIAFASNMVGGPYQFDIYTIAPDGTDLQRLTSDAAYDSDPAWSPDSARLAFTSAREGSFDVFTMKADGTDERRLTFTTSRDGSAWWAPDGHRIVFASDRSKDMRHELYVMPAGGGDAVRLTRQAATWPRWCPRGDRIVFTSNGHGNEELFLLRVPVDFAPTQRGMSR